MSGGSLDFAFQRLFDVLDTSGWKQFVEEYPYAAALAREDIERLAGQLRAIEWHTSGDGAWPPEATEDAVVEYLLAAYYKDPYDR